jgi:hypothetical protein
MNSQIDYAWAIAERAKLWMLATFSENRMQSRLIHTMPDREAGCADGHLRLRVRQCNQKHENQFRLTPLLLNTTGAAPWKTQTDAS